MSESKPITVTPRHGPIVQDAGVRFQVWGKKRKQIQLQLESDSNSLYDMVRQADGFFTVDIADAAVGDRYQFVLDGEVTRPDPASRFQPDGVHGPSQVMSSRDYPWEVDWSGIATEQLVIYELHVGAFSSLGTYQELIDKLDELREIGFTAIELLPVAQTPGKWNWGYDGVYLFAPRNSYGSPDELRRLVDQCHRRGMAVILDVVYNHLGPEGNYLADFAPYFSSKHRTPWGDAFGFDGRNRDVVRGFIIENVLYWLDEFRLDGLRLDAVHFMFDDSHPNILADIRKAVRRYEQDSGRKIHLIAEANVYDPELLGEHTASESHLFQPDPYDAIWCDDLMHSIYSTVYSELNLTHRDYAGPEDISETLRCGYIYQGPEVHRVQEEDRRRTADEFLGSLVVALQTHDSVGNHPHGLRLHQLTSPETQMAAAALTLLYPTIPLIFMGEERASEARFPFFVDFGDDGLRRAVDRGRAREYPQHAWNGALSPSDPRAFEVAKLDSAEHDEQVLQWYRHMLAIRSRMRELGVLTAKNLQVEVDSANGYFLLRYHTDVGRMEVHTRIHGAGAHRRPNALGIARGNPGRFECGSPGHRWSVDRSTA